MQTHKQIYQAQRNTKHKYACEFSKNVILSDALKNQKQEKMLSLKFVECKRLGSACIFIMKLAVCRLINK